MCDKMVDFPKFGHNLIYLDSHRYVVDKIYAKMVQGLVDYAQKLTYYANLAAPDPSLTL